jgi:hypothetical protein
MNDETPFQSDDAPLRRSVLGRITQEGICPRGRWWFRCWEGVWWGLWVSTMMIAAMAVAVTLFVVMHRRYALYEATHDTFMGFMLDVLPYLWVVVFAAAGILSYYYLRHTKRGYRYSFVSVVGIGVAISLVGGLLLHTVGMGIVFDATMGRWFPAWYWSQGAVERHFWQAPTEGRLLAVWRAEPEPGILVVVEDLASTTWQLQVQELFPADIALLRRGKMVRILGRSSRDTTPGHFHACGVFPWNYDMRHGVHYDKAAREEALTRLREHRDIARETFVVGASTSLPVVPPQRRLCGEIAAVKRLK